MHQLLNNIQTFLSMGGYAGFVWPSYGAMILLFIYAMWSPLKRFRRIKADLRSKS